jgi:hypothetical protein
MHGMDLRARESLQKDGEKGCFSKALLLDGQAAAIPTHGRPLETPHAHTQIARMESPDRLSHNLHQHREASDSL